MNHRTVRTWLHRNAVHIDTVSAAIDVLGASCRVLAAIGPEEQLVATPPMLTMAAVGIRDALDNLADAPRIPDLPLDLMMAGAIGKLRRCTDNVIAGHHEGDCPPDCGGHIELEQWTDNVIAALQSWSRFKEQLTA